MGAMNKICPLMSFRNVVQSEVYCYEKECALWGKFECGLRRLNK